MTSTFLPASITVRIIPKNFKIIKVIGLTYNLKGQPLNNKMAFKPNFFHAKILNF